MPQELTWKDNWKRRLLFYSPHRDRKPEVWWHLCILHKKQMQTPQRAVKKNKTSGFYHLIRKDKRITAKNDPLIKIPAAFF